MVVDLEEEAALLPEVEVEQEVSNWIVNTASHERPSHGIAQSLL